MRKKTSRDMMHKTTKTDWSLQLRREPHAGWFPVTAEMYNGAMLLAQVGQLIGAIEEAYAVRIAEYGNSHGVDFRCVTTTRTVTTLGEIENSFP